jgi:hypothetical protein
MLWKRACEGGDPAGCRYLGGAYLEGRGFPKGTAAAKVWLQKACEGGDTVACAKIEELDGKPAPKP